MTETTTNEAVLIEAALIDPFRAETRRVTFERGDLKAIYALLDCDLIDIVRLDDGAELVIDDEGLLKADNAEFCLSKRENIGKIMKGEDAGAIYRGKALLVGPADSDGNMTSVTEELRRRAVGFNEASVRERAKRELEDFQRRIDARDPAAIAAVRRALGALFGDILPQATTTEDKTNG